MAFWSYGSWADGSQATDGTGNGGINQGADQGRQSQSSGSAANMAAGMALMAIFMAGCNGVQTWGCFAGPLAALAFMQGGHDAGAAGQSTATYDATIPDYDSGGTGYSPNPDGISPTDVGNTVYTPEVKKNLDTLAKAGYKVDPQTGNVTTPEGTFPASTFDSPASMAAAGIPVDVSKANEALAEINEDLAGKYSASVGAMELETGGGGGGGYGGSGSSSGSYDSPLADYFKSLKKKGTDKDRMIAGKSLTYGNDPIGVKVDDIFMMVHRRYQAKRKINTFIERAPASKSPKKRKGQL